MFHIHFKKRSLENSDRRSTPVAEPRAPVFSYHANRAPQSTEARANGRTQPQSKAATRERLLIRLRWLKRAPNLIATLAAGALIMTTLYINDSPKVAPIDTGESRIFLRRLSVYQTAAHNIFKHSIFNGNKITIDTNKIAKQLYEQFPELQTVSVTLPFLGHQPIVYIQAASPRLILNSMNGGSYVLDANGRALLPTAQAPQQVQNLHLPVVTDQSGLEVTPGKITLPSDTVAFIGEVARQLKAHRLDSTSLTLPASTTQLDVRLQGQAYAVKFNLHGKAREEAGTFLAVRQQLEADHKTPTAYIDVRVEGRAYYK